MTWSGVDLFFVLSGFLITGILFDTRTSATYFRDFYIRRALRIFPLYYGFFALVLLLWPLLHLKINPFVWGNLFYLLNLTTPLSTVIHHGNPTILVVPFHGQNLFVSMGPWWSLCVEEQFYLLWPLIVWRYPRRDSLLKIAGWGVIAAMFLRVALYFTLPEKVIASHLLYLSPFTRADSLLMGAWLAIRLRGAPVSSAKLRQLGWTALGASVATLTVLLALLNREPIMTESNPVLQTVGYTLVAVASSGILLLAIDPATWLHRAMRHRWLVWLGRISYGFYFFHDLPEGILAGPVIAYLEPRHLRWLIFPIALAFTLTVAVLSFRFWESMFLRMKDRLAPTHHSVPTGHEEGPAATLAVEPV